MGTRYRFRCLGCEYEVDVAGGPSTSIRARAITIVCDDCHTLQDAVIYLKHEETKRVLELEPRCIESESHKVQAWKQGQPCPKCGGKLAKTGQIAIWN